ncbi:hypothetical protein TWF102_006988 [Orbilia oligospora]|uniref:Phytocyanin domain-containing protein n=1 Tax=Orbilia oligospora TaxID=2813651 RepID=A0A7C8JCP4_ORBOL|nr:hypothetical protein TWF103_005862 [Orbilia oligospora]KAF3111315.1 hypothetical protein TWF102_006988 [Orbilia oligospora]
MARDPNDPGLCFSNPAPRWNVDTPYNISTTFRRGLCQVSVTFSDNRFPVLFFTTTQALDDCGEGEVNQIRLPTAVPNGIATIEQTCAWSSNSLCVSVSVEGGANDPSLFAETGHFTVERLCAKGITAVSTGTAVMSIPISKDFQSSPSPSSIPEDPLLRPTNPDGATIPLTSLSTFSSTDDALDRRLPVNTPTPSWGGTTFMTRFTSKPTSTPLTSTFVPQTHTVNLDYSQNAFVPNQVEATVGDVVQFMFLSPGHNIMETSLQFPCTPEIKGFESGLDTNPGRNFNNSISFTVTKLNPRYFACGQPEHCQSGMVFAVNAGELRFSQFLGNIKSSATSSLASRETATSSGIAGLNSINVDNNAAPTVCSVCPTTASMPATSTVP